MTSNDEDQKLSKLLSIKRHELPREEFWEHFGESLKKRQLMGILQEKPLITRLITKIGRLLQPLLATTSTMCLFTIVAYSPRINLASSNLAKRYGEDTYQLFALDVASPIGEEIFMENDWNDEQNGPSADCVDGQFVSHQYLLTTFEF
jgi:hypothetical protein